MHRNAGRTSVVLSDGHFLYRRHDPRNALWRVHAAGEKVQPVGDQKQVAKVGVCFGLFSLFFKPIIELWSFSLHKFEGPSIALILFLTCDFSLHLGK